MTHMFYFNYGFVEEKPVFPVIQEPTDNPIPQIEARTKPPKIFLTLLSQKVKSTKSKQTSSCWLKNYLKPACDPQALDHTAQRSSLQNKPHNCFSAQEQQFTKPI